MRSPFSLLLCWIPAFGCAAGPSARAAFVQEVLVRDNRVWLSQDTDLVADKFAVMADDPYDFMRGSVALHFADLSRPDSSRATTRFLRDPAATAVLLVGDPHPENVSVCRADPTAEAPSPPLTLEFVDLDAAGFGPWTLDVRRAAIGLRVLTAALDGCDESCAEDTVEAMTDAYSVYLSENEGKERPWGVVFSALLAEATREGRARKKTEGYTTYSASGARSFVLDTTVEPGGTAILPLDAAETNLADDILAEWSASDAAPDGFRVLDVARRFGSGVSSRPALRFVVAYDLGASGPEDDAMMQIREVVDPPDLPGRAVQGLAPFENNGQRVWSAAQRLWSRPDADARNGYVLAHGRAFKSLSWTSWFQDIDHDKIIDSWNEGYLAPSDLADFGWDLGRLLAGAHSRGGTMSGADARAVILADLDAGGGPEALSAEIVQQSQTDVLQLFLDAGIFADLLDAEGPLLGAERIAQEAW